ncbi:hypothetical protein [Klebsiella aerogenes]|uniref:hypothetical protein n=1 Tax=Klebsiella aerogenes TaxID=548 RepID=UPI001BD0608C|nr:hypothetical protein [Klebsiella aerogenes]EJC6256957.1 hypothetical protein [Klebsiella aerogenes]HBQ1172927.1 hypothetical protein [Klebsiella aerogenes]HDT1163247.1 hypothetical protein [Klebsiella aerogenes]
MMVFGESLWLWVYYIIYVAVALIAVFLYTRSLTRDSGEYEPDMMDFIIVHIWAVIWPVAWSIELAIWLVRKYQKLWRKLAVRS